MNDRHRFRALFNHETTGKVVWIQSSANHTTQGVSEYIQKTKWLQCTGLVDKNGTLIFEGDILNLDSYGDYYITWDSHYVCFDTNLIGVVSEMFMITNDFDKDTSTSYEIIGNVQQHPHLMEQKNE